MANIAGEIREYLSWMEVHNYARTTIENRRRYLDYFLEFTHCRGVDDPSLVTFECLLSYQQQLFEHRKRDGLPLTFGTQVQRLVPVTQFFTWLRREHRINANPAADLLMPRPDRKLPEATLSAAEMAKILAVPDVATPLGPTRSGHPRGVLFLWHATKRADHPLGQRRRLRSRNGVHPLREGSEGSLCPHWRAGPLLAAALPWHRSTELRG